VDERRHLDLVIKYAYGHVPRSAELISTATLPYLSHYASPEFLAAPEDLEGGYYGPMWMHAAEEVAPTVAKIEKIWGQTPNQESSQPPLYYVAGAAWFHIGQWIGVKGGSVLSGFASSTSSSPRYSYGWPTWQPEWFFPIRLLCD